MSENQSLSLSGIFELLFRHKKKIIVFPLLAIASGMLVLMYCPRTFRSEAMIFLRIGRETVGLDPVATTGHTMSIQPPDRKDEVKSTLDVLESRDVTERVVDMLSPDVVLERASDEPGNPWVEQLRKPLDAAVQFVKGLDPISDREEAIVRLENKRTVHAEKDSTVIDIRYSAKSPAVAQQICDAIVQVYLQEHLRIYRNEESRPFFTQQRDRLREELDAALEQVRQAKDQMGASNIDERRSTLEKQYGEVELERYRTQQEFATVKARVAEIEGQLTKLPERQVVDQKSVPNQGADLMRDQLYALEMKAMDLESRYSDSHPLVQAIKGQLDEAKQVVAKQSDQRVETTDSVNPIHRDLSLQLKQERSVLAGYEARLAELQRQKTSVATDLRTANEYDVKVDRLQRQADLARNKFFQYAQNLEEARMDQELENGRISNVSVLQPATLVEKPVSPNKAIVALGTLIVAIFGTASLVLASEAPQ